MPKRFSTLLVSMVCSAGTSTRRSECSGRKGIVVISPKARVVDGGGKRHGSGIIWGVVCGSVWLKAAAGRDRDVYVRCRCGVPLYTG